MIVWIVLITEKTKESEIDIDMEEAIGRMWIKEAIILIQKEKFNTNNIDINNNVTDDGIISENIFQYLWDASGIAITIAKKIIHKNYSDLNLLSKKEIKESIENNLKKSEFIIFFIDTCDSLLKLNISYIPNFNKFINNLLMQLIQNCTDLNLNENNIENNIKNSVEDIFLDKIDFETGMGLDVETEIEKQIEDDETTNILETPYTVLDLIFRDCPRILCPLVRSMTYVITDERTEESTRECAVRTAIRLLREFIEKYNISSGILNLDLALLLFKQLNDINNETFNNNDNNSVTKININTNISINTNSKAILNIQDIIKTAKVEMNKIFNEAYMNAQIVINISLNCLTQSLSGNKEDLSLPKKKSKKNNTGSNQKNENVISNNDNEIEEIFFKKNCKLQLSEAPALFQRATELLYRLDNFRLNNLNKIMGTDSSTEDKEVTGKIPIENPVKIPEEIAMENTENKETISEEKDSQELDNAITIKVASIELNSSVKSERTNINPSYSLYLRGLHWYPVIPVE